MTFAYRLGSVVSLLFLLAFAGTVQAQEKSSPSAVVRQFQAGLLSIMKESEKSTVKERYDRLAPLIEETYLLGDMIRIASGGSWTQATPDQKDRLRSAFKRMGVTTLATLFSGYSGESFEILGESPGPQDTMIVASQIARPGKPPVAINYVTRRAGERWYVIDVILDKAISELKVRQSEYRAVLQKDGIEGLIEVLNGKADQLVAQ
jgi:phospholipid transport system substrate-binding protein